ncbi:hypothetical protein D3C85_1817650 [compost metagenome]
MGTETTISLPSSKKAKPKSLRVYIRGAFQAPVFNYSTVVDGSGNITAIEYAAGEIVAGDLVSMTWINA